MITSTTITRMELLPSSYAQHLAISRAFQWAMMWPISIMMGGQI